MTCVLSMNTLYSRPCAGFTSDAKNSNTYEYDWLTNSGSRLTTDTASTTCSCRFDNHNTMCRTKVTSVKLDNKPAIKKEGSDDSCNGNEPCDVEMKGESRRSLSVKRKLDSDREDGLEHAPPKRISPFLNTPKERKEERRKVLKISIQKFRKMEDPENFLRRSVLINNTLKKVQKEIREEKQKSYQGYKSCIYRLRPSYDYDVLNNSYLQTNGYVSVFEDQFSNIDPADKLADEITDSLVRSLEETATNTETSRIHPPVCKHTESQTNEQCDRLTEGNLQISCEHSSRDTQLCSEMDDVVFNNLIRALGET